MPQLQMGIGQVVIGVQAVRSRGGIDLGRHLVCGNRIVPGPDTREDVRRHVLRVRGGRGDLAVALGRWQPLRGQGRGGRNVEFLLALGVALDGLAGVYALAGDTDGVDGAEEIAGAVLAPNTLARAWAAGINPGASLDANDGHGFFQALGDSVITGPTLTNVNDFRAILIEADPAQQP